MTGSKRPQLLLVNATGLVSGAERVLIRLACAAGEAGWDVIVASPDGALVNELTEASVAHHRIPDLKLGGVPNLLAALLAPVQAARAAVVLRRLARNADVVVVNHLIALPAIRLARLRTPVAWYVHEFVRTRPRAIVARLCSGAVAVAVCVSEAVARSVEPSGTAVQVVRNGTPWPVDPARPATDPPVIGECAGFRRYKGQDVFLEAVARLDHKDAHVELVGGPFPRDRKFWREVEDRARRPDLAGRVQLVGEVADPLERMRGWRVAVLPTTEPDPAPLAVVEAMSIGVPVVTTDHGGSPEVLGDAGLVVPPCDPVALAAAISRLLDDRALYARCSKAGPRIVADKLTFDRQYSQLFALFAGLRGAELE